MNFKKSLAVIALALTVAASSSAFNVVPVNPPLPESSVDATLVFLGGTPGNQIYRYDFTVRNISILPAIQTVLIFFDSDPVTGEFTGDKSDFIELTSPSGWEGTAWVDPDPSPWFIEWMAFSGPARIFPGKSKAGFSVTFVWKDPTTVPGQRFFEAMNGEIYEGQTLIVAVVDESGAICGTVHDECITGNFPPVTVDLFDGNGNFIATTSTDQNGKYCFGSLYPGNYSVSIIKPLGFVVDAETKTAAVSPSETTYVDFTISCLPITPSQRTIGYWKHQVNALLTGKGKPQESLADMISYLHAIRIHFNENIYNPVIVYEVNIDPDSATATDSLLALSQLLTINKGATMLDRAKQQFVALLLNVASLKISQAQIISADGAIVSQAITYCNAIITNRVPGVSYEVAKGIADMINNGITVPAGVIPLDTEIIWYSKPKGIPSIVRITPNPASEAVAISYYVPEGVDKDLRGIFEVYDVMGRCVFNSSVDVVTPGEHSFIWNCKTSYGQDLASGAYFVRLKTPAGISTQKIMIVGRK